MTTVADAESLLRSAALRVTRPRVAVLVAVHERPHADTETLIGVARDDLGAVSHQAIYDVLRVLTDAGLLRRIQPAGSVARYEARVGDNHHHLVCRSCGSITDVDCAVGDAPCLSPPRTPGTRWMRPRSPTGATAPPARPPRRDKTTYASREATSDRDRPEAQGHERQPAGDGLHREHE